MICTKTHLNAGKYKSEVDSEIVVRGKPLMPDIAREAKIELTGKLDRVGMTEVEVPVLLKDEKGQLMRSPAKADIFVSLDDESAKGIHMSRLFISLQDILAQEPASFASLAKILKSFIESHKGISESSFVRLQFEQMLQRPSLKSQNLGWRSYPMVLSGSLEKGQFKFELETTITYSSTCPCSAALSRQLIQENFRKEFGTGEVRAEEVWAWLGSEEGINATPHSQRSYANIRVTVEDHNQEINLIQLIDSVENSLGTPVQAAVKREDEQEFARLNAQNLMFCEDAARKIKNTLNQMPQVKDFWVKVSHVESLHPHNAVSIVTKNN